MRKVLIAILVVALFSSFLVFADESNFLNLFDSVQIGTGFDMFMAKGKIAKTGDFQDNRKLGFGIGLSTTFDLSAIPNFPSDDWRIYVGYDMFFSSGLTHNGAKLPSTSPGLELTSSLGMKFHMAGLYHTMLGTPVDFYFGAGLAWGHISGKISNLNRTDSTSAWGLSIYAETSYEFVRHFAAFVSVIPDITFVTKTQRKTVLDGTTSIERRTCFGIGFDISAKTGIKYVF